MATNSTPLTYQRRRNTLGTDGYRKRMAGRTTATSNRHSYQINTTRLFGESGIVTPPRNSGPRKSGKRWHKAFDTRRDCYRRSMAECDEQEPVVGGNPTNTSGILDEFLGDDEDAIPSWQARTVRRFFEKHEMQSEPDTGSTTWAWLDDREYSSGSSRQLPRAMDIDTLRAALRRRRYGHAQLPDSDRRLVYVSELDPPFIVALAEAAEHNEKHALQDAICKHIASVTAFRVHVPMTGFATFRLEFHLSYLVMREKLQVADTALESSRCTRPSSFADLSFLSSGLPTASSPEHTICEAHISIIVFGESNNQWTGYAFAKTGLVAGANLQTEHVDDADDANDEPRSDFFAADRDVDYVVDSDNPIWDARSYWLQIVAIRCQLVLKEWLYIVHTIEECVESLRANDPCSKDNGNLQPKADDVHKSLQWTLQAMQLLKKLLDSLSTTLRAYERFNAPGGDKCYFSDMNTEQLSDSMKGTFEQLADLELKLTSLDDSCKRFATHLGRILDLESNVVAQRSNEIQEQTQRLAESTIELNTEIRRFNEISSEAARANQADAAKTSLSTRVNVELLLLTTPFGMVLQYFGSEKDIFSFTRNTKTFVLSTVILMLVLRVLALLLEHSGKLLRLLPWKVPFHDRMSSLPKARHHQATVQP